MATGKRTSIPSKEAQLFIVGPKEFYKVPRAQRLSFTSDIPSTTVDEIGNSAHAGESKDTPNVTVSFSVMNTDIKLFAVLTGNSYAPYPAGGVDISSLGEVDAALFVKDSIVADYVKSIEGRRLQVRDLAFSFSVDGEATEDYTMVGSERRYLRYDVYAQKFVSGGTSLALSKTPLQLRNFNYAISVIVDSAYLTEVTGAPSAGQYRVVGTTVTLGTALVTQAMVVYHANPTGDNWADVHDTDMPAAIKGRDNKVVIAANDIPRVQSVTINTAVNLTPVKEMGNRAVVGYTKQNPTVEGTLTVLDTDEELINLFQYGTVVSSGHNEWQPGEGCITNGIALSVQLLDPCDDLAPYTVLKEIYLDSIVPVGDAYTVNVNNSAQLAINFKSLTGHCVVYSGEHQTYP